MKPALLSVFIGAFIILGAALSGCAPSLISYQAIGKERKIDSAASLIGNASIEINAPTDIIWKCLIDVQAWPDWNPEIKSVQATGPLALGSAFTWGPAFPKIRSEVVYCENGREIIWIGRMLHIKAIHKWNFSARGNATMVATEESLDGKGLPLFFRKKKLQSDLNLWLKYLKNQAEAHYLGERENSARMIYDDGYLYRGKPRRYGYE